MIFSALLMACADPLPTLAGEVTLLDQDLTGQLVAARAFAHAQDGSLGAYISSSPDTTCDGVVSYLSDSRHDASSMFLEGHCNFFIYIDSDYDSAGFAVENDLIYGVSSNMSCALGEGAFVQETPDAQYAWSGQWWQGAPTSFSYDFSDDGTEYALNVALRELNGSFSQEGQMVSVSGTSNIDGLVMAESCPELASTYLFD
jgi:hypothetical protein